MTQNQINYVKHLEQERTNKVQEAETKRHNLAMEYEQSKANAEIARANRAAEAENIRRNTLNYEASMAGVGANRYATDVNADVSKSSQYLNFQTNKAKMGIDSSSVKESVRHNKAVEQETHRKNTLDAFLKAGDIVVSNAIPLLRIAAGDLSVLFPTRVR